jgi:hypothetical protein
VIRLHPEKQQRSRSPRCRPELKRRRTACVAHTGPCRYTRNHRAWSVIVSAEFADESHVARFERYLTSGARRRPTDFGSASLYEARSHAMSCRSTWDGPVSLTSRCQRFADVCSRLWTRGLRTSHCDLRVRTRDERRVATPANAVCRTRWIEVFFASSATGPSALATSRTRRYVASTEGSFLAKCDSMLMPQIVADDGLG